MARPWSSGDHVQVTYSTDEERRKVVATQFFGALEVGEKIAYVADEETRRTLRGWLYAIGSGVASVIGRGQVAFWPALEHALPAHRILDLLASQVDVAERAGYPGLRVTVDMGNLLEVHPLAEALVACERSLASYFAGDQLVGLTLVCCYDRRRFSDHQLDTLGRLHVRALTADEVQQREPVLRVTRLADRPGLRLAGEIDRSNLAEFSTALKSVCGEGPEVHLELADLRYADVGAVELLVHAATSRRDRCQFVLHSPAPIIRTILRIYGWDELPALTLVEETAR